MLFCRLSSSLLQGSIPFNETKAAQGFFVTKVVSAIRQRWHALYFDPELLSSDTIHVNLFQMLVVAAHRFTILVEMLPFVNRDMLFFSNSVRRILKKMTKGIHRSLEAASESGQMSQAGKSVGGRRKESPKLSYQAQKHQVRMIPTSKYLGYFQLTRSFFHAGVDDWSSCLPTDASSQERPNQGGQRLLWTTFVSVANSSGRTSNRAGKFQAASSENSRYMYRSCR